MESGREFEGRSLQEALERARGALGVDPGAMRYEIIDDGRRGFLGLGARPVKIRAWPRTEEERALPAAPAPPRPASGGHPSRAGAGGGRDRGSRFHASTERRGHGGPARGGQRSSEGAGGGHGPRTGQPPRRQGGPLRGEGRASPGPSRHDVATAAASRERPSPVPASDAIPYSRHEALRQVAGRILGLMRLELRAKLREGEDVMHLELSGADAPLLVEHDGEALEALQHLLNKIMARDERFGMRVIVDCDGFRSRHDEEILARARRAADEALSTGRAVHLDGLNPYERRLVHLELVGREGILTYSVGQGSIKRLTVEPAHGPGPAGSDGA